MIDHVTIIPASASKIEDRIADNIKLANMFPPEIVDGISKNDKSRYRARTYVRWIPTHCSLGPFENEANCQNLVYSKLSDWIEYVEMPCIRHVVYDDFDKVAETKQYRFEGANARAQHIRDHDA